MNAKPRRVRWEVLPLTRPEKKNLAEVDAGLIVAGYKFPPVDPGAPPLNWKATRDGERVGIFPTKARAIEMATTAARSAWRTNGTLATLKIKGRNGRIQDERTYGRDPIETKG